MINIGDPVQFNASLQDEIVIFGDVPGECISSYDGVNFTRKSMLVDGGGSLTPLRACHSEHSRGLHVFYTVERGVYAGGVVRYCSGGTSFSAPVGAAWSRFHNMAFVCGNNANKADQYAQRLVATADGFGLSERLNSPNFQGFDLRAIACSQVKPLVVAMTDDASGCLRASTDLKTWYKTGPTSGAFHGFCWVPEWDACYLVGDSAAGVINTIAPSADGQSFTVGSVDWGAGAAGAWRGMAVGDADQPDPKMCMVGADSAAYYDPGYYGGAGWTACLGVPVGSWFKVIWHRQSQRFIAIASAGANRIMTSSNGKAWTAIPLPSGVASVHEIVITTNNHKYCVAPVLLAPVAYNGDDGTSCLFSGNGSVWLRQVSSYGGDGGITGTPALVRGPQARDFYWPCWSVTGSNRVLGQIKTAQTIDIRVDTMGLPSQNGYCMIYSEALNRLVWIGHSPGRVFYLSSPSAMSGSFTEGAGVNASCNMRGGIWAPSVSKFLVGCTANGTGFSYAESADGINWTMKQMPNVGDTVYSFAVNPSGLILAFAASSDGSISRIYRSTDAVTWIAATPPAGSWRAAAWGVWNSRFVARSTGGTYKFAYSGDGITWTGVPALNLTPGSFEHVVADEFSNLFHAIAYGDNLAQAIASSGDGETWAGVATPIGEGTAHQYFDAIGALPGEWR